MDFQGSSVPGATIRVRPDKLGSYQMLTILDSDPDGDGTKSPQESTNGTNPHVADTDGNGVCDGPKTVAGYCTAGP